MHEHAPIRALIPERDRHYQEVFTPVLAILGSNQSLERGFSDSFEGVITFGVEVLGKGLTGSAGVPSPDSGLTTPLGATGILISSGELGIMELETPSIWIRLPSF